MPTKLPRCTAALLFLCAHAAAGAEAAKKITYQEDVLPIFKAHCLKCHGEDEQKAGLALHNYAAALKGGSGGEVLKPNRANSSDLFLAITHGSEDVEKMPPKSSKIPDPEIEIIRQWIMQGLPESSGSVSAYPERHLTFTPSAAGTRPMEPAMPQAWPDPHLPELRRPAPVTALAASPWAPVVAVAGYGRVLLKQAKTGEALGVLAFPEGTPFAIRFSRDGALLLVAGGQGASSGKAVLYDVKTGKRLAEYGDETDAVLAADLSPDQKLIAIGGPSKVVKVFHTSNGKLAYKITKHTDWITALEFSPDGAKLASGDRNGGIHIWDAQSGGIAFSLSEHKDSITALAWRPDGVLLASSSEDGQIILWDAKDGWPANSLTDIHKPKRQGQIRGKVAGGALALAWTPSGALASTGRDGALRLWDCNGGKINAVEAIAQLPTRVAASNDSATIIAGDAVGGLKFFAVEKNKLVER